MTVIYVYDLEGWALHAIGRWLAQALPLGGVEFRLVSGAEWRANPVPCDVLYLSYSGLVEPGVDYRRWARRVVTTIHDPCELSFFESRDDWAALPLRPLPLAQVDDFSVISRQLRDVLASRYQLTARLTPTWSERCERLKAGRRAIPPEGAPLRAVSSTNVPVRRPIRDVLRNIRHPRPFLRDERGRLSLQQLGAIGIRRRRKRVEWLEELRRVLGDRPSICCDFVTGTTARRTAAEYEASLRTADVYLCTSTMEGGPLPVLEAVMAGAAVLSTRVGQVPDWIEEGRSGFFCATLAEFAERLIGYDSDRSLLRQHQARAREVADALAPDLTGWQALLQLS
jgi:glycosyltransferase involved in cell wall biosynthesis